MAKEKRRKRPTPKTVKSLFALSGNLCAYPKCVSRLVVEESVIIAKIAHIEADKPGGPRYNPNQTEDDRRAFENLMLLCANDHDVIDDDSKLSVYTVDVLQKMKRDHESKYRQNPFSISEIPEDELKEFINRSIEDRLTQIYEKRLDSIKSLNEKRLHLEAKKQSEALIKEVELELSPQSTEIYFRLLTGLAAANLGLEEYSDAVKNFKAAYKYKPNDQKSMKNLALAYLFEDNPKDALKWINLAFELDQQNSDCVVVKAHILLRMKKFEELLEFIKLHGDEEHLSLFSGLVHIQNNDYQKALEAFEKLHKLKPQKSEYLLLVADSRLSVQRNFLRENLIVPERLPDEARAHFEETESVYSKLIVELMKQEVPQELSKAYSNRAAIRLKLGLIEDGLRDCNEALKIDPSHPEALKNKAMTLMWNGKFEEASKTYEALYVLDKNNHDNRDAFLQVLLHCKKYDVLQKNARGIVGTGPLQEEDVVVVGLLTKSYLETQEHTKAKLLANKLSKDLPNSPMALRVRAYYAKDTGDIEGAGDLFAKALQESSEFERSIAQVDYANYLMSNGNITEAKSHYEELSKKSKDLEIKSNYAFCLHYLGEYQKALGVVQEVRNDFGFSKKAIKAYEVEGAINYHWGNLVKAAATYKELYEQTQERSHLVWYGLCLFRLGKREDAKGTFDQIKNHIETPQEQMALAKAYLEVGDYITAIGLAYGALKGAESDANMNLAYFGVVQHLSQQNYEFEDEMYVAEYQNIACNFATKFPDDGRLQKIPMEDEFREFFKKVDDLQDHAVQIEGLYKNRKAALSTVAKLRGKSLITVWYYFAHSKVGVISDAGNADDIIYTFTSLDTNKSAVIDLTSLLAFHELGKLPLLNELFEHLYVHQAVLDEILSYIAELRMSQKSGHKTISKLGEKYVHEDVPAKAIKQAIKRFLKIQNFVEKKCEVVGFSEDISLEDEKKQQVMENTAYCSGILSQQLDLPLISDDLLIKSVFATSNKLGFPSTQYILRYANHKKIISEKEYHESILQQLRWGYTYISVDGELIEYCLEKSLYRSSSELVMVLETIGKSETSGDSLVNVLSNVLKGVWIENLPHEMKVFILQTVLSSVTKEHDVRRIARPLLTNLKQRMALTPVHYDDLEQQILGFSSLNS